MPMRTRWSKSTPSIPSRKPCTKCWRDISPSLTMSIPASSWVFSARIVASRLASAKASPDSRHAGHSTRGSASQDGFGRLPAIVVSSIVSSPATASEIRLEVPADAVERRLVAGGRREFLAGDGLEGLDIDPRRLGDRRGRDRRDRLLVGIAARRHPAPQHVLVEAFRRPPGGEAFAIGGGEPVAAAVGRMALVREQDVALAVAAEL